MRQLAEQLNKAHILLLNRAREHLLADGRVCSDFLLADLDPNWLFDIAAVLPAQRFDFLGPCCTKHERLSVRSHMSYYPLKLLFEAHILLP